MHCRAFHLNGEKRNEENTTTGFSKKRNATRRLDSFRRNARLSRSIGPEFHMTERSELTPPPPPASPATALLPGLDEPNWTEIEPSRGIPTSGLYLQLTVIWMQLMVSSRSTKTELFWGPRLPLDSEGVVLSLAPARHSWACLSNPHVTHTHTHKTELSPA